jgi:cytochrome b
MPVWDIAVRLFHWALVVLVSVTAATGFLEAQPLLDAHLLCGTAIAALVTGRVIWGFTGTTYARFAGFLVSPPRVLRHIWEVPRGEAAPHVGHNPVGGWMIVALLATLMLLAVSGAIVLGGILKDGPLAPFVSYASGRAVKEAHELLAFGLLALVALHVAGVVFESVRTRDNLVAAMLRGWKPYRADAATVPAVRARPVLAVALTAALLLSSGTGIVALSHLPVPGLPAPGLDPAYAKECGSCHSAHHPSVAAAATWSTLMQGLDSHFGENAGLDEPLTRAIATYLATAAAERWDTKAAHRLATADEGEPLRITATKGWRRLHRHVASTAFERKSVGGKLNCSRCHRDAETGRFHPRAIAIPEEKATP